MVKEKKKVRKPSFEEDHHKKLTKYIDKQNGDWFALSSLKKKLYGRTDYGGRKYLQKLILIFRLNKKKESGRVMLKAR